MPERRRLYSAMLAEHLAQQRQMALVAGPRQVGKTTTCRALGQCYLDWDNQDHRAIILAGPKAVAEYAGLDRLHERPVILVFDELHKYRQWKNFLKGLFDTYGDRARIVVTGSSPLDVYRRGGDSLMGRYFLFHMHPFSVAEIARPRVSEQITRAPARIPETEWQALWEHGGYPEPFVKRSVRFSRRWQALRLGLLFREEIRDLTRVQELGQIETLGRILAASSGEQLVYANLARAVRVSENTVRSWVETLCSLHFGFLVRPWFKNVQRSLRKEPKWFLRDWSTSDDGGARAETFCACHLLKAVEGWTELGLGHFALHYVRDKQQHEVDFLVVRDNKPWLLVEAKQREQQLSPDLEYFYRQLTCPHALQVVVDAPFMNRDCFEERGPVVVPARTFLSQLL